MPFLNLLEIENIFEKKESLVAYVFPKLYTRKDVVT